MSALADQTTYGRTKRGRQRYKCRTCQRVYTPAPLPLGDADDVKREAVRLHLEGTNAGLRHYLARPGRRSRCFSRCVNALTRAVDLFVRFYNARQIRKRKYPRYPAPLATMI